MISYINFSTSIYKEREADAWLGRSTVAHGAGIGEEKRETVALCEPVGVVEKCKRYWTSKGSFSMAEWMALKELGRDRWKSRKMEQEKLWLGLLSYRQGEDNTILLNASNNLPNYTVSHPRIYESSIMASVRTWIQRFLRLSVSYLLNSLSQLINDLINVN